MADNKSTVEVHGCIVCGKLHNLLVVYSPGGKLVGYTVTGYGCHPLSDTDRPLVVCNVHTEAEIKDALARHHPGPEQKDDPEED
jgi:hypothetical protein